MGVDCEALERTISSLQEVLHPQHYLLAQLKLVLLNKYSFISQMTRPIKERILQLGQELAQLTIQLDSVFSNTLVKILNPVWSRMMMISNQAASQMSSFCTEKRFV